MVQNWLKEDILPQLEAQFDVVAFDLCSADKYLKRRSASRHLFTGVISGGDSAVSADYQPFCASAYSCAFLRKYAIRFHCGQRLYEDTQFMHEARSLANECCFTENLMYVYRNRPNSAVHQRAPAITRYTDLFEGFIKTHAFLAHNGFVGKSTHGIIQWYLNDMCIEHFREQGTRKELLKCLEKYSDYMGINDNILPEEKVKRYMSRYPQSVEYTQRLIGIAACVARKLSRISFIAAIRDRKRYPIIMEN